LSSLAASWELLAEQAAAQQRIAPARKVASMATSGDELVDDDAELMRAYARGELRAFERLYAKHRAGLYRYLMRHTRDADAANDLFQETWSRVIANRDRYQPRARFQTFLFTLARNCFIDHYRRGKARGVGATVELADAEELLVSSEESGPEARLEQANNTSRYRAALAALPAEQRDVYLLHEESELSLEEIASVTGVGVETAKSRLRYAVSKLKQALQPLEA
jgi:RNA polymerase sigma-70 factor (ECF subfamily)